MWFAFLGFFASLSALCWLSKRGKKVESRRADSSGPSAQDFLQIEGVRDGILVLPGNRYRLLLEVFGSVNFHLLSDAEQNAVEDAFRALLASLSFPVQFYVQTRLLDLTAQIGQVKEAPVDDEPPLMRQYRDKFAAYLTEWMKHGNVLVTKKYVVIPYDGPGDFEEARRELWRRRELIEMTLRRWLGTRALSTEEIVECFYVLFNKDRANVARVSDAVDCGFMEPIVRRLEFERAEVQARAS